MSKINKKLLFISTPITYLTLAIGNVLAQGSSGFEIENPIGASSFEELINAIGKWIFNISIPLAVIVIVYAGIKMLLSQGNQAKITEARKILTYAIAGLAIIFIGKGFITLIKSVLELAK